MCSISLSSSTFTSIIQNYLPTSITTSMGLRIFGAKRHMRKFNGAPKAYFRPMFERM